MIAHLDISTGAAGDKIVCALMQACEALGIWNRADFEALFETMLPDAHVSFTEASDHGIRGLRLSVTHSHHHNRAHHHGHGHDRHHAHEHEHGHHHGHGHHHRSWADIREMIGHWSEDMLPAGAVERSLRTFELVARAESQVHGTNLDEVHFHEVGAIDSIVDTVGACLLMDKLGLDEIHATPITVGFGTVDCAHGTLPVPAPATALLLEGLPVVAGPYEGEMTTPTGAALLHANVTRWEPFPPMIPRATGFGLGTRSIDGAANCLRVIVGEQVATCPDADEGFALEQCILLQANIDHISPEVAASCCSDLLEAGALDVWQEPITMKKGRLAFALNILVSPAEADRLARTAIDLTGTLGIRRMGVERVIAPREQIVRETEFGPVRFKAMKASPLPGRESSWIRPEHDDVARIARKTGLPYEEVLERLDR